jgi:hypothetical protein
LRSPLNRRTIRPVTSLKEPQPKPGVDYPRTTAEFLSWFGTDEDCLDYLRWLRWPDGFLCPRCGDTTGWRMSDGRWCCRSCDARTSLTAGTIFDRTRTPLTVWFHACWLFSTQKDGISALSLQRAREIGSYQTERAPATNVIARCCPVVRGAQCCARPLHFAARDSASQRNVQHGHLTVTSTHVDLPSRVALAPHLVE